MARSRNGGGGGNSQPIRVAPGQPYGTAQAQTDLQSQSPLPAPPSPGEAAAQMPSDPTAASPPSGEMPFVPPSGSPNVFGPGQMTGAPAPLLPDDQYGILSALLQRFPNDDLRRLREQAAYLISRPQI